MTPDRWLAIGKLFDLALAVPTNERTVLIDRVSGTDEEVRREVRSLLASPNAAPGGFVQKRIDVALDRSIARAQPPARRLESVRIDWYESLAAAVWARSFSIAPRWLSHWCDTGWIRSSWG